MVKFENIFLLLAGLAGVIIYAIFLIASARKKKEATLAFSNPLFAHSRPSSINFIINIPKILRVITLLLIAIALGRPYTSNTQSQVFSDGINIVIALDISKSMEETDLSPNRLERARQSIIRFISNRPNDPIALVLFGKDAYLQSPLTLDHSILLYFLRLNGIENSIQQSTAIGTAITTSIVALKNVSNSSSNISATENNNGTSQEKTGGIIILVTDGDNTSGEIDPITAAQLAESFNIKIYTIGIGSKKNNNPSSLLGNNSPAFDTQFNETMLRDIATISGGAYFNVQNNNDMTLTYRKIDEIEKQTIENNIFFQKQPKHAGFIFAAFFLFVLESFLRFSFFRKLTE